MLLRRSQGQNNSSKFRWALGRAGPKRRFSLWSRFEGGVIQRNSKVSRSPDALKLQKRSGWARFPWRYRCTQGNKNWFSAKKETFLDNSRITVKKAVLLAYQWSCKANSKKSGRKCWSANKQQLTELGSHESFALERWEKNCLIIRLVVLVWMLWSTRIKLYRRKYYRGKIIQNEADWAVGGICRQTREVFRCSNWKTANGKFRARYRKIRKEGVNYFYRWMART